jgi:hypothetical protein
MQYIEEFWPSASSASMQENPMHILKIEIICNPSEELFSKWTIS